MDRARRLAPAPGESTMKRIQEAGMMSFWRAGMLALAAFFGVAGQAHAQNAIQSINSSQQAGAELVRIELAQPLARAPNGFAAQTPPPRRSHLPGMTHAP